MISKFDQDAYAQVLARIKRAIDRNSIWTESTTIRCLIEPILYALGWELQDPLECQGKYRHTAQDNPVDLSLFLQGKPSLFVETKQFGNSLDDRKWVMQALRCANSAGVKWAALTNGQEWRLYNSYADTELENKLFFSCDLLTDDLDCAQQQLNLISRTEMLVETIDQLWQKRIIELEVVDCH